MKSENLIFSREDKKIYKDGDRLVKVFDGTYSKANILNEALNHARVEETNLNVPPNSGGRSCRRTVGLLSSIISKAKPFNRL